MVMSEVLFKSQIQQMRLDKINIKTQVMEVIKLVLLALALVKVRFPLLLKNKMMQPTKEGGKVRQLEEEQGLYMLMILIIFTIS